MLTRDGVHGDAAAIKRRAVGEAHVREAGLGDDGPDVVAFDVFEISDDAHCFQVFCQTTVFLVLCSRLDLIDVMCG